METTEPVPEPSKKQKKGKKRNHEEDNLNETASGADDTMEVSKSGAATLSIGYQCVDPSVCRKVYRQLCLLLFMIKVVSI